MFEALISDSSYYLSNQQWYGTHVIAETLSLEVQSTGPVGEALLIQTKPHTETIEAGTTIKITSTTSRYAKVIIGDRQLMITRQEINRILVQK